MGVRQGRRVWVSPVSMPALAGAVSRWGGMLPGSSASLLFTGDVLAARGAAGAGTLQHGMGMRHLKASFLNEVRGIPIPMTIAEQARGHGPQCVLQEETLAPFWRIGGGEGRRRIGANFSCFSTAWRRPMGARSAAHLSLAPGAVKGAIRRALRKLRAAPKEPPRGR